MKYTILPKLTKDYILQRISQEDIFAAYLELDHSTISYCLSSTSNLIKSTIRKDKDPTCGFKYSGTKLRFKDFNGFFWGDCFDLVGHLIQVDCNSPQGFAIILDDIAKRFKLHKYQTDNKVYVPSTIKELPLPVAPEFTEIKIGARNWNEIDADYWGKIYLTKGALKSGYVCACQTVEINNTLYYDYAERPDDDVAYAYYFGNEEKSGKPIIKVYFPRRKKRRFIMNKPVLEGLIDLQAARVGLITKAYKDVLAIRNLTRNVFDLDVIGLPSENYLITEEQKNFLWTKFDHIVTLLDFDFTGRNTAWKYRTVYNIPSLFLTNGKINTINYGSKDFTDYLAKNKKDKTMELVSKSYDYVINKYTLPDYDERYNPIRY